MTDAYNERSNQLGWCITTKDALEEMRASCASAANNVDATLNILRQANTSANSITRWKWSIPNFRKSPASFTAKYWK